MRSRLLATIGVGISLALAAAPTAQGDTITAESNGGATAVRRVAVSPPIGSGWLNFIWYGEQPADPTFSFTTKTAVRVTVTDAYCKGDAFTLLNAGEVVAVTPTVAAGGCPGPADVSDPDVALKDPSYSHTSVVLKPGTYDISIVATENPYGSGGAFIRFDFPPRMP